MKTTCVNVLSQLSGVKSKMSAEKVIRVKGEVRGITYFTASCSQVLRTHDTVSKKHGQRSMIHPHTMTSSSRVHIVSECRWYSSDSSRSNTMFTALNGALSGVTVLDLTRVLAGPFCTQFLGDLGAEVIKVEEPEKGDDTRGYGPPFFKDAPDGSKNSAYYVSVNRNKESIAVNLKHPLGVDLIHRLASRADVVLENFTPGVAQRLGIGFDSLSQVNEKLIYCSISGFGQSGAYSRRPGYDVIASSIGGLLSITGPEKGDPCRPGVPVIDQITGLYAIAAILTALYRQRNLQLINILDGQFNCNNDMSTADVCQDVKRDSVARVTRVDETSSSSSCQVRANSSPVNNDHDKATERAGSCNLCMHSQSGRKLRDSHCHSGPVNIDVNLLSSQISVLINIALNYLNFNLIANRRGTAHETIVPYQAFACKSNEQADDEPTLPTALNSTSHSTSPDYLTVIAGNDTMFPKLIKLLFADDAKGQHIILNDEKFKSNAARQHNRYQLVEILQRQFLTKTRAEWMQLLAKSGLPYGPVNTIDQVFDDADIKSQTTFEHDGVRYLKNAVKFHGSSAFERSDFIPPPSRPGQDTRKVLTKLLNVDEEYLQHLASAGVIRL